MPNKLQELTDKLYNEGLSRGRVEGEELVAKARAEAEEIVSKAREEAATIITAAESKAEEVKSRCESDLKMASQQAIASLKIEAENVIRAKAVGSNISAALSDAGFVRDLLKSVVSSFNASDPESKGLDVILPASERESLEKAFEGEVASVLGKGVEVRYMKGLSEGFKIGPKEGGYIISFTADDFSSLVAQYLRPATRRILFG